MKIGLAALAVVLTAFAGAANAQPVTLKLAFFAPPWTPPIPRWSSLGVMELPAVLRDVRESSMAIRRLHDKGLLRGCDNFYVPMLVTTHPYTIHTNFPVKKISDLRGKKLRAGGPVAGATIRALGAVPVGMPIPAVAENISKGILSGSAAEWNVMYSFRIIDVAKHHYMARLGTVPFAVLFNKKVFDGLPGPAMHLSTISGTVGIMFYRAIRKTAAATVPKAAAP